jgi:hypothetical protein
LEISVRLDAFSEGSLTDVGQLFPFFVSLGRAHLPLRSIEFVFVTQSGAILCDMFGKQYRSHDNAIKVSEMAGIIFRLSIQHPGVA